MFLTFSQFTETLHTFYTMNWYSVDVQVVKQTVMTVVYGVTWVGGRLQIEVRTCVHVDIMCIFGHLIHVYCT